MIDCPMCSKMFRHIHEYISSQDIKKRIVYYCCDCDYTLILSKDVKSVIWQKDVTQT